MAELHILDAVLEAAGAEFHILDAVLEATAPTVVREFHILDAVIASGPTAPIGPGGSWAYIDGQYVRGRLFGFYDGAYR